eukprot:3205227-Amphidinium_carterae.1
MKSDFEDSVSEVSDCNSLVVYGTCTDGVVCCSLILESNCQVHLISVMLTLVFAAQVAVRVREMGLTYGTLLISAPETMKVQSL